MTTSVSPDVGSGNLPGSPWSVAPSAAVAVASGSGTREALLLMAEGITLLVGFDVAAVSVLVETDGRRDLVVMAVAGDDEARLALDDTAMPVEALLGELEQAEDWGWFKFVPQERRTPASREWGWTPRLAAVDDPRAWQPLDLLIAPLHDQDGVLLGMISIDCPTDGLRPDLAHREVLNRYAAQAARTLALSVQTRREAAQLAERVRLLAAARDIVRGVPGGARSAGEVDLLRAGLTECFRACGMWVHLFDDEFDPERRAALTYIVDGETRQLSQHLVETIEAMALESWSLQQVARLGHRPLDVNHVPRISAQEAAPMLAFMAEVGVGTALFAPLGAGTECLGSLVMTRGPTDPAWTDLEIDTALEIGRDLGRSILHARMLKRERQAVRELQALDDYRTGLITTLSHELKSPLAVMLGNLEVLGDRQHDGVDHAQPDPEVGTLLAAVGRGADRLVRVVESLLALARVKDASGARIVTPVDLTSVFEEVRDLTPIASQHRLTLTVGSPDAVLALGEEAELETLVSNLVGNALKYSPGGTPVAITLSRPAPDEVLLTCTDQGIGIAPEDQPRVFEEFFRSENDHVRRETGTGLGLAIVDRIVTRHGGRIEMDSALGVGTTVRVWLPPAT